jgi:hypothetical protein
MALRTSQFSFRSLYSIAAVLFTVLILLPPAHAQTGTNFVLQGNVQDSSGGIVAGASVTIKNLSIGLVRTTETDSNGHYIFSALPPAGTYELKVEMKGFGGETITGLTFQANAAPVINVTLKPGSMEQSVTVSSAAPIVETDKSEIDHTIDQRQISNLPTNGRSFFDFTKLAPGAVFFSSDSGGLTFNGQGERQLTMLADGVNNQLREIRTLAGDQPGPNSDLSLAVVQDLQVVTNNFSAEFGRSPSGVINVITKSGTNDWHGQAFFYERPGSIDATQGLTGLNPNFNRQEWGGEVGGPIAKDKAHFLASYEQTHQTQNAAGITSVLEPNPGVLLIQPARDVKFFGKVDDQISKNNRLTGRYNIVRGTSENGGVGGLNTSQRIVNLIDYEQGVNVALSTVFSPRLVNEFRFGYTKDRLDICAPNAGGCTLTPDFSTTTPAANYAGKGNLGPNPSLPQNLRENGYQWIDTLSHTIGKHNLKYGGDFEFFHRFVTFYSNFNGTYNFPASAVFPFNAANPATFPNQYTQSFGISGLPYNEWLDGLYIQDSYNLKPNFTVNVGLRYDYETILKDSNNFAPRIGFAWDPFSSGKTLVRASFGLFYATIESSLINRESNFGPLAIVQIALTPANVGCFPTYPARFITAPACATGVKNQVYIPITRGLGSDFPGTVGDKWGGLRVNPYTEQLNFGISREFTPNWALSVDYIHVHGLKLLRTRDLNSPSFFLTGPGQTRTVAQADATRPFGAPSVIPGPLGVTFGGFRQMLDQESGDQSFYDALQVVMKKRFSHHFNVQANYVWSKNISDSDNFRLNFSLHLDPNRLGLDRGLADQDRTHNFAIFGTYDLPYGFQFSGIVTAISGFTYNGLVGSDANGDTDSSRDRPGTLGRNTFRARRQASFDSSLSKAFKIKEQQEFALRFEAFNTFNHVNVTAVNTTIGLNQFAPPATFGRPTQSAAPRQFQFSAVYKF